MTPESFAREAGVSRETLDRFAAYADLLRRWNPAINLVGPKTLPDLWSRHFADSAQLLRHLPAETESLADLGSGAGFPGLVLAILGVPRVHLVESDQRKATFLREAARVTGTAVEIHANRLETVSPLNVDIVTARALAPLADLLMAAERHLKPGGTCLFLKGRTVEAELTQLGKSWRMRVDRFPSTTDPSGIVLRLSELARGPS